MASNTGLPGVDPDYADLLSQFVDEVRKRLSVMAAALARLAAIPGDDSALQSLAHEFHGLAGSGSAFGFPALSSLGRRGDSACMGWLTQATQPDATDLAMLQALMEGLCAVDLTSPRAA